jgi:glycosyltransferase involved in cell wall biosynthesis
VSFLDQITALVLTCDEAANIGRTLDALRSFPEVVVLDSGSTDGTLEMIASRANTRLVRRAFDNHASQWNYGLRDCGISRRWVLALDADYVVNERFVRELAGLAPPDDVAGYRVAFDYCIFGSPLRGNLYPPVVALFRKDCAHYVQTGHTQRLVADGAILNLAERIAHDDRKPLSRWLSSQRNYARLEARHLLQSPRAGLRRIDRLRLMVWPAPLLAFFYTLIVKRCVLDGWRGLYYALQRLIAESLIALEIIDQRRAGRAVEEI